MKEYIKRNKLYLLFIAVLLIFGIVVGLYFGISHIDSLKEDVLYYTSHIQERSYNYLFFHFFVLVLGVILSFFGIGVPFLCALLFYEGMSIGFLLAIFAITYGFNGFLFAFIFLLITKLVYLICFWFLFSKCVKIARKMIGKYLYKTDPSLLLVHLLKGVSVFILFVMIYDVLLWWIGKPVITWFQFLLQ